LGKQVREVTLSWDRNKPKARRLAIALLLSGAATAAAADVLVVRSAGPSAKMYPPGKALSERAPITLRANDMLVVLDGRGTRTIRGPGTFAPGSAQARTRTAAVATAPTPLRRARIGAVRGTGTQEAARPSTLWHIDVARSSNICLADKANVTLWRADATKPVTLTIAPAGGAAQKVRWASGQPTLAWPSEVPIADGTDYSLSWDGAKAPTRIKFKTLPNKPAGLEDMASSLIRNNCDAQLDLLIETVKLPEGETPPG
jgi:hypothetical protein